MARSTEAEAIYEAAEMFRRRCLVDGTSLLWPDRGAWTPANLDALWAAFVERPDAGKRTFMEKWRDQLADQPPDVHRIAVDALAFYLLFPSNIGRSSKLATVREALGWKLAGEGEPPGFGLLEAAFGRGLGHSGIYYLTGRPWQVAYYLAFARRVVGGQADPYDAAACQALADSVRREVAGSLGARHILLHLLFPERYEAIASEDHKRRIAAAFPADAGGSDDLDERVLAIRRALSARLHAPDMSFYQPDVYHLWNLGGEVIPPLVEVEPKLPTPRPGPTIEDLAAATHLDPAELKEIEELLLEKRQLIFEGPPGSGKTYVAELFARWFVGLPLGGPPDDRLELVQFHQSYGYEDFVQGIRPETDAGGRLSYRVRDGIFKRLCGVAAASPDRRHVLVVDEINRGNLARIFGELLLLLEYRQKRARLPYAAPDDDDGFLSIPDNLYLIGTMNSTDRSLAQVDYALRRRFYFRRFLPVEHGRAPVLEGWLKAQGLRDEDRARLARLFVALNRRVEEHLSADFQVGHSYFMVDGIETEKGLDRVWRRGVRPLLEEYFHHHRDRDALLAGLTPERLLAAGPSVDAGDDIDEDEADRA